MNDAQQNDPIIAYRVWATNLSWSVLESVYRDGTWPVRERFVASCQDDDDNGDGYHLEPAPISMCDCGVYGFKTVELTQAHLYDGIYRVAGRVALWGTIIDCERGYRAQYAYPQLLYYSAQNETHVRGLAACYGIDAVPLPECLATKPEPPNPRIGSLKAAFADAMQANLLAQQLNSSPNTVWYTQQYDAIRLDLTQWVLTANKVMELLKDVPTPGVEKQDG